MSEVPQTWSRDQVVSLLEQVELFRGLPAAELHRVADIATGLTLDPGEVLFEETEPGDAFYIVFDGAVEIVKNTGGADEEKLAVRRRGQGFGEMALLDDAPRSATARAVDETRLMVIGRDDFHGFLGGDSLPLRLLRILSSALRALDVRYAAAERALDQKGPTVDPELASRLIQRSMLTGDAPSVAGIDIAAGTTLEDDGRGNTVWDAVVLPDGRDALMVMEVRAEGLPAAHVLGTARTALRAAIPGAGGLAQALARANDALADVHVKGVDQFVECAIVVPDADGVEWACAGRVPGAILGRDGTFRQLGSHGPPLGMMAGFSYGTERAPLGSGSSVLVLSGGSTGLFRGAADLVAEVQGKPAGEVVGTIHRAIRKARGGQEISVLFMRRH